jgi:hypothetical protein
MQAVVEGWREIYAKYGVEPRSLEMLERAILPPSYLRTEPPEAI